MDPEKLSELGAELLEEGKAFNKAITKYKRAFFNELANEVSAKSPLINSIDILSWESMAEKVEIVRANEANQEKLHLYCLSSGGVREVISRTYR